MSASASDSAAGQTVSIDAPELREALEEQVESDSPDDDDVFMAMSEGGHGSSHCSNCFADA